MMAIATAHRWGSRLGLAASGSGGGRNGLLMPLPPRCGVVLPAPLPGRADGDDGDHGARAAARSDAGNHGPLRNNDAAPATVAGEADDAEQENNDCGSDDGDDDEDNNMWGMGT